MLDKHRNAPLSSLRIENEQLRTRIKELFAEHNGMVGSPMITADFHEDPDFSKVSRNRVARHMKEMGLKCRTVKKFGKLKLFSEIYAQSSDQ